MVSYPPYVNAYGKIEELFEKIREAAVPPKVTNDFLSILQCIITGRDVTD